jgi:hypothetical protein
MTWRGLDTDQPLTRARLAQQYKARGRTLALRAALQDLYQASSHEDPELLRVGVAGQRAVDCLVSANSLKLSDHKGESLSNGAALVARRYQPLPLPRHTQALKPATRPEGQESP